MKIITAVVTSLLVLAESAKLENHNSPTSGVLYDHGSSSSGGGSGSFISTDQGFGGSHVSSDHNSDGSFVSSGQRSGGSFISSGQSGGGSFTSSGQSSGGSFESSGLGGSLSQSASSCGNGQVLHVDGRCVTPQVIRHIYVYNVPEQPQTNGPRPQIPLPKVEHNILFVRLPENAGGQDPIVIPPPQQKNVIYILNKGTTVGGRKVINVQAPAKQEPEVYFVNYGQGQNPTLPGGIDLQTALNNAVHQGLAQVIGGGSSGVSSGQIISGGSSGDSSGQIFGGGSSGASYGQVIAGGSSDGVDIRSGQIPEITGNGCDVITGICASGSISGGSRPRFS